MLAARPQAYERSIQGLAALQKLALPAWLARAELTGLNHHIHRHGGLYVFTDAGAFEEAGRIAKRQAEFGIRVEMIGPEELRQLEPALKPGFVGATFHPDAAHISDPLELTLALFEAALARGAVFEKAEVTNISTGERPALIGRDGWQRVVDRAVIAAGAWSKPLAAALGDRVPLDTERGYNVSFPGVTGLTTRPVGFEGHGFVMTPLRERPAHRRRGRVRRAGGCAQPRPDADPLRQGSDARRRLAGLRQRQCSGWVFAPRCRIRCR